MRRTNGPLLMVFLQDGYICSCRYLHYKMLARSASIWGRTKTQSRITSTDNLQLASKQSSWPRRLSSPAISHLWSGRVLLFARYHFVSWYSVFCVTLKRSRERSLMTKSEEKENRQADLLAMNYDGLLRRTRLFVFYLNGPSHCIRRCNLRPKSPRPPWDTTSRRNGKIKVSRRRTFSDVTSRINITDDGLVTEIRFSWPWKRERRLEKTDTIWVSRNSYESNLKEIWWQKICEVSGKWYNLNGAIENVIMQRTLEEVSGNG